jgi:phosphoribosylformylglycinamidine (FGAM) synthase-like enzyme
LLAHPNIRSKENMIRRYDHEVQAGLAVKPLVGVDNNGPADAAVAYGVPFISGKDSLNNEYTGADGRKHAIHGTLLISGERKLLDYHMLVVPGGFSYGDDLDPGKL